MCLTRRLRVETCDTTISLCWGDGVVSTSRRPGIRREMMEVPPIRRLVPLARGSRGDTLGGGSGSRSGRPAVDASRQATGSVAGGQASRRDLVGREADLERLLRVVEDAGAGAVGVVLVSEAGMGKTALLDAMLSRVADAQVLRATGIETHAELPFAGLHQLLGPVLPAIDDLPPRQREVLGSALAIDVAVAHDGLAVAAAVLGILAAAMGGAPLLLVIDDAQWIDTESLEAVMFACARMRDQPLALIMAARSDPGPPPHPRDFIEISLAPLDVASARALACAHAPVPLDRAGADRIATLAGGVPLAIIELATAGGLPDTMVGDPAREPGRIVGQLIDRLFGQRVERLTELASTAALIAALDEPTEHDAFLRAAEQFGAGADAWAELERASIMRTARRARWAQTRRQPAPSSAPPSLIVTVPATRRQPAHSSSRHGCRRTLRNVPGGRCSPPTTPGVLDDGSGPNHWSARRAPTLPIGCCVHARI
jgi:hypothetical protein